MQYVAQGITDVPFHGADMEKKFEIVKYVDPRFDCNNSAYIDNRYVVVSGGPQISRYETECDEYTNDIIRWGNRRTLGSKFLYDSHWYINYTLEVKVDYTLPWNVNHDVADELWRNILNSIMQRCITFKPFPLTQATRSIQLKLNDKEISCMPRETLAARMEYWDPKALYKGCSTCPCERPNVQSVYQFNDNTLTSPFREVKSCLVGEKSNSVLPYTQCDMHLCNNGVDWNGGHGALVAHPRYECVFCNQPANNIDLPWAANQHPRPNQFYWYLKSTFYEPVLIEPLTFTNGSEFNPPMWNLDNFELTYNIDDLKNMLWINKHEIVQYLCGYGAAQAAVGADDVAYIGPGGYHSTNGEYRDTEEDRFTHESRGWRQFLDAIDVRFAVKPKLVYYVYTPIPGNEPRLPYMAPYKEFKRYRYSGMNSTVIRRNLINNYRDLSVPQMVFDTGRIDMVYYPHSIYMYVAEANDQRLGSTEAKITHAETFAKIKKINCIYGNCTTILDSFKELDFYNMSVRNGLKGRSFADWNMMNNSLGLRQVFERTMKPSNNNIVPGVGSVVRLTPGIDLHTGGMTGRMIGGCPAVSKSITFQVIAEPLDIWTQGTKNYELYVIFEQQGALVMQDGQCRVGLVGCESVEWYDMQPLAQVSCDTNMYGSEIGGGSFFAKARKVLKKGANVVRKAAENNMFSKGLGALGELTGNQAFNKWADRARKVEGLVPRKKQAMMNPNAPPTGSGYKRFYH